MSGHRRTSTRALQPWIPDRIKKPTVKKAGIENLEVVLKSRVKRFLKQQT